MCESVYSTANTLCTMPLPLGKHNVGLLFCNLLFPPLFTSSPLFTAALQSGVYLIYISFRRSLSH